MKNLISLLFISFFIFQFSFAQSNRVSEEEEAYTAVEQMPTWQGCEEMTEEKDKSSCTYSKVVDFLVSEIIYPEKAKKEKIQGTVYVSFIIDKTGKVTESKVLRGVTPEIDAEALRIVSLMPDWNPGKQKGETVNVVYNLPIRFTLKEASAK